MKAVIIGATSGIGLELAKVMTHNGWEVGLTGRRINILQDLQKALAGQVFIRQMDITQFENARAALADLVEEMEGMDVIVVNAGIGTFTRRWEKELPIIQTNATGFAALANWAYHYFQSVGHGQLVGISSLAALRSSSSLPSYHASKAFISSYMQGLRYHAQKKKLNIQVTDIRPGFVRTAMTAQNGDNMFWDAPADKAARQIFDAIQRKKKVVYITKRWRLMAWFMRAMPDFIYTKIT